MHKNSKIIQNANFRIVALNIQLSPFKVHVDDVMMCVLTLTPMTCEPCPFNAIPTHVICAAFDVMNQSSYESSKETMMKLQHSQMNEIIVVSIILQKGSECKTCILPLSTFIPLHIVINTD